MGLFSRKDSSAPRKPPGRPRPSVSSEAQAAEFRTRARRRLAGAVALVLAAVVVLPMLLDSEPAPLSDKVVIKIPDRNSPFQPQVNTANLNSVSNTASGAVEPVPLPDSSLKQEQEPKVSSSTGNSNNASSAETVVNKTSTQTGKVESKTDPKLDSKTEAKSTSPSDSKSAIKTRSDDGAVALALLEGRNSPTSLPGPGATNAPVKAPTKGNFVVQAASLDTQADAQGQRDKLIASGVSNAFVDGPVDVAGRQKFRVKVGPFSSREAAQAAQTRLRTLGFGGAFIASQ
jgi:DedD protein